MRETNDDREGRKPYRTFKAGRARRSSIDDELAGARPPRRSRESGAPPRGGSGRRAEEARPATGYQRYECRLRAPRPGGRRRRCAARGAGDSAGGTSPWGSSSRSSSPASSSPSSPGRATSASITPSTSRTAASTEDTRAQLTPDRGWIWRRGTTLLLLGVDSKDGEPARSDTIMLMHFDPGTHTINQFSIPRDTRVDVPGRGYRQDQRRDVLGRPLAGARDGAALPRHPRQPRHGRQLQRLPAARGRRRRRRHAGPQDHLHRGRQRRPRL